ncbi:7-cyano-7-deazaguanine synthase [Mycobacteroides abscessus]
MTAPARPPITVEKAANRGVLLLSGGLDSVALAALLKPTLCLAVDYGQRPASAELQAAQRICHILDLPYRSITIDLRSLGAGLLLNESPSAIAPSPEWWPFRNQFLATAAAAVAIQTGQQDVYIGTVAGDGDRHADGTPPFYAALNAVLAVQEGSIQVHTPGIALTTTDLVKRSMLPESAIAWTVSCHRTNTGCGACPGCWKRQRVLRDLGILGFGEQP